jgi:hypothetical protein
MVNLVKSNWRVVYGFMASLSPPRRERVDALIGQAIGYVWGWQDAGGAVPELANVDASVPWEFGYHYGRIVAEVEAGIRSGHGAIQSEWSTWCTEQSP